MATPVLYNNLRFYSSKDAYHILQAQEPGGPVTDRDSDPKTLVFDRKSGEVTVEKGSVPPTSYDSVIKIYGVFGILPLLNCDYLILITEAKKVATVLGSNVYNAVDYKVFPISSAKSSALLASPLHPNEAFLLALLKAHLYNSPFYFSYGDGTVGEGVGYDLTTRLQAQSGEEPKGKAPWERADDRFFWNRYLCDRLIELTRGGKDATKFILPVMFGFFEFKTATINGETFLFGLISRRNRYRAGTRYFSRGIDQGGNVSNFNETEMITILDKVDSSSYGTGNKSKGLGQVRCSYVQTRGSVPIFWAEINNLRYKPDLRIMDLSNTTEALRRHFDHQVSLYGDQYLVNLVNQKGYEKPVKDAYEKGVQALANPKVHYTYFDFHHECKGLRFDRVQGLIDGLEEELLEQGYFHHDVTTSPTRPQRIQRSVVRTNCMDCLDRTNVVQSALAKWVLNRQLKEVGILNEKETIDQFGDFIHLFRNVWADNADVVSKAYSGTGALKTDYTRTGKRSKAGALQDGYNSAVRYLKNNFFDGSRQDAYDLISGTWKPRKGKDQAFIDHRPFVVRAVPYVFLLGWFLIFAAFLLPELVTKLYGPPRSLLLVSFVLLALTAYYLVSHGVDYVAWPRLNPLTETINYSGKGYESGSHGRGWRAVKKTVAKGLKEKPDGGEMELGQKKRVD